MKIVLGIIALLIVASIALFLLPLVIGIFVAVLLFQGGNILGGIITIVIALPVEAFWWWYFFNGDGPSGSGDGECPYCGSGDTDGNHCYTCDDDF